MSIITELQEQLQTTQTAAFVTTMLRDISANRLQSIRSIFDANKAYYEELHELTALVAHYAEREGVALPQHTKTGTLYIAVTANNRFYGNLNNYVMDRFARLVEDNNADGYVIGATGAQYLDQHDVPQVVGTTQFAGSTPSNSELQTVVDAMVPYASVVVVHPTFINSFEQKPAATDVTHRPTSVEPDGPAVEYICEPELGEIMTFFQTQIRIVLLSRTLLETRLALTAARLMKMQRARERATERVKKEERHIHREISTIKNLRLLETFAGFTSDRAI